MQFSDAIILKSQQGFKSNYHNVYTEQINKIALSRDDDKRLQTYNEIKLQHIHLEQTHSKYAKARC